MKKPPRQWRTFVVTLAGFGVLLLGFHWAKGAVDGKNLYAVLRDGVVILALGFGARSVGQDFAAGGVRGALKGLLPEQQPEPSK